jgi:hypothetical protein
VSTLSDDQTARATPPTNGDEPNSESIKPAPIEFGANDRRYRQVWRQDAVAILESRNHRDVVVSFEVVLIHIQLGRQRFGKWYDQKEMPPGNEDFGKRAWALPTRDLADQWAALVLTHLAIPARERTAFPLLMHEFSVNVSVGEGSGQRAHVANFSVAQPVAWIPGAPSAVGPASSSFAPTLRHTAAQASSRTLRTPCARLRLHLCAVPQRAGNDIVRVGLNLGIRRDVPPF